MREWAEQRAELLQHVDELRDRARLAAPAQATRLGLAATVLLGAVQLAEDELPRDAPSSQAPPDPATASAVPQRRGRPRMYAETTEEAELTKLPLRPSKVPKVPSKGTRVLCPLCGAPRHRKDKRLSFEVCSWRQWATKTGRLPADAVPTAEVPDRTNLPLFTEYRAWMAQHPDLEAGSVPAEKIFRQRMRDWGHL